MTDSTAETKDVSTSDTGEKRPLQMAGLAGIVGGAFFVLGPLVAGLVVGFSPGDFVSVPTLDPGGWPHFLAPSPKTTTRSGK